MNYSVPTINLDFYSTFAELIGYEIPKEHIEDGTSIMPVLKGEADTSAISSRLFSWHYPLEQPHFLGGRSSGANRKGDFKYIKFFDDGSEELYNLQEDESETTNLSSNHLEKTTEHKTLLDNWITEVKGKIPDDQQGFENTTG